MQITVNGQQRSVPAGASISQLLEMLCLEPGRVAVERNKQLVPRARHGEVVLADRDELEIVTLVGGG